MEAKGRLQCRNLAPSNTPHRTPHLKVEMDQNYKAWCRAELKLEEDKREDAVGPVRTTRKRTRFGSASKSNTKKSTGGGAAPAIHYVDLDDDDLVDV